MKIQDGKGTQYQAGVTLDGKLETFSTVINEMAIVSKDRGKSYILATDYISLSTTASFNALAYIKNNSDKDLLIHSMRTCSDATGSMQIRLLSNPTAGTIVSDANVGDQLPANVGSSEPFGGLFYSASGDGKTFTDGDNLSQFINKSPGHSVQDYEGSIVIPKGKSIGLQVKPSVATTICCEIKCWFE